LASSPRYAALAVTPGSREISVIELVDRLRPALVLMDINMPEMNGIEAARRITAAHPDVVVFLCSTYEASDLPSGAAVARAGGHCQ
jgi:CheY-like chemotaxis protein